MVMNDALDVNGDMMEDNLMEKEDPADLMEAYGEVLKPEISMELTEEWRTEHFGCFTDDCSAISVFMSLCCYPCSIASAVTDSVDRPAPCDYCCICYGVCATYGALFSPGAYTHFRKQYKIKGAELFGSTLCCDCWYAACCPCCMSCQIQNQSRDRNVPPPPPNRNEMQSAWTQSNFFDFTNNILGWLYGCFCPYCAFAQLASVYAGTPCLYECCCGSPIFMRYNMRHHWNIEPTPCGCLGDTCALACCPGCSYTQMKAEVDAKGPMFPVAEDNSDLCPRFLGEPFF